MAEGPCFYCLDPKIHVAICLSCRYKLEKARDEVARLRKSNERYRRDWFNIDRENRRLREALSKKAKKP